MIGVTGRVTGRILCAWSLQHRRKGVVPFSSSAFNDTIAEGSGVSMEGGARHAYGVNGLVGTSHRYPANSFPDSHVLLATSEY